MILLHTRFTRPEADSGLIAIFGVGLLGAAIRNALQLACSNRPETLDFSWDDRVQQQHQLSLIRARVVDALGAHGGRLAMVWSAGKAGFDATTEEVAGELENFRVVLGLAESVADQSPQTQVTFYLLSSVGGLFEGQRHVDECSAPVVRRPYGALKQHQERLVLASDSRIVKKIYRLTSVVGVPRPGQRKGLIATLIRNGLRQKVTRIVGRMSTLRDFVWHEDVGKFLAQALLDHGEASRNSINTLASARPASIHEILRIVERTIGRRLYTQWDRGLSNSADITLAPVVVPVGWHPTDLPTYVKQVHLAWCRGEWN